MNLFKGIVTALKVLFLLWLGLMTLGLGLCSFGVGGSILLSSGSTPFAEVGPLVLMGIALTAAFGAGTVSVWKSLKGEAKSDEAKPAPKVEPGSNGQS